MVNFYVVFEYWVDFVGLCFVGEIFVEVGNGVVVVCWCVCGFVIVWCFSGCGSFFE